MLASILAVKWLLVFLLPAIALTATYAIVASLIIFLLLFYCSLCHVVPGLAKLLLPRINPFALISCGGAMALVVTHILIDMRFVQMLLVHSSSWKHQKVWNSSVHCQIHPVSLFHSFPSLFDTVDLAYKNKVTIIWAPWVVGCERHICKPSGVQLGGLGERRELPSSIRAEPATAASGQSPPQRHPGRAWLPAIK